MPWKLIALLPVLLLWLPGPSNANETLPVAEGRYSVAAVLDATTARPTTGSWVEFIGESDKGIPQRLGVVGFVLGTRNDVVLIEVTEAEVERLALARATRAVRFQQIAAPDPDAVAERRRFRETGQPVTLAPRLRTITVPVESTGDLLTSHTPGDVVIFPDLSEVRHRPSVTGTRVFTRNVEAMLVSARQTGPSQIDVTIVAEPRDAFTLLQAATQSRLTIASPREGRVRPVPESRCYIRHRRGEEVISVEIPCRD